MKKITLLSMMVLSFFGIAMESSTDNKKPSISIEGNPYVIHHISSLFSELNLGSDPIDAYAITKKINELNYYAPTTPVTPGTATTFTGTNFFLEPSAVALSTTQFVIAYRSSASGTPGEAIVGTLSGNAISFGSSTQFAATVGATHTAISAISATQFIVAFEDERGASDVGEMRIGTVSGSTIAFGSSFDFAPGDVDAIEMEALSSTSHIVVYRDVEDSNRGKAKIITVSGTTLSFGTAATFLTDATIWTGLDVLSSSTFVIVYQATTAGSEGGAVIGSVSGSTITLGSANIFETNCRQVDVVAISSDKFVVAYDDDDDGNGYVQVGSVSGTTITGYGTRQQLITTVGGVRLAPSSSDKFIAMYTPTSGTDPIYAREGEVTGTNITLSAQATIHSGNSDIQAMEVLKIDDGKQIYIYQDESNSSIGTAIYGEASAPVPDTDPPVVTSISLVGTPAINAATVQYTVSFDENANNISTDDFSLTTTSGTASGTVSSVSSSSGTSVTVTINTITGTGGIRLDLNGSTNIADDLANSGPAAFNTGETHTVDRDAPTGYSVAIDQNPINAGNDNAVSYTFSSAEVGATYNYTFSTSGGAGTVTGSGTVASAGATISGIDLTGLADGTITLSVTLTDVNGNTGSAATDTETKETVAPTGYSVAIDQNPINAGNDNAVSYTFSSAEVGATYNYTFSTSGGAGTVTGSGTVASAGATISGIDLTGLADGTITLSVTLTDINGNTGSAATDTETKETVAPTGYSVAIDQNPINAGNDNAVSYTFSSAEVGATYNYTFSTSGGAGTVTGSGTVASAGATISGIDLTGLADGTITLSVTLTDVNGNTGSAATDTETKETVAPTGYSVAIDQSPINAGNDNAVSYTFSSAEVGATYNYTFSTSGGAGTVTGSGTVASAGATISGIDLTGLADGTITLSVTLTDVNGNTGSAATDTETKETIAPTGYSVAIDQSPINAGNDNAVSYTFSSAEVGATYNYTFSTSGGAGTVTGSGTVASAGATISGIDLTGLADGTITLSVTLTDVNGNTGSAATDTETKETVAPTGYSVAIDQSPISDLNDNAVSYTFSSAEVGATYNYTFSTSGGAGTVTGSGTVASAGATISSIDLSGLADGTITLSVTLTDVNGNTGSAATDTETKDTGAPTGYLVAIDQSPINAGNDNAVSYTFSNAEVGATYNYTFSTSGGAGTVTGSGIVASAGATISSIDLSGLSDGTITLSVTLTDINGNTGSAATDTETKDTLAPTGYSVAIDQSPINAGNNNAVSYTFSSAEVGATYNYIFSSSGGGINVTGSGTVASSGVTISSIDLSGLGDGTITLSVTLTDVNGNTGNVATDTENKKTIPPTATIAISDSTLTIGETTTITVTFSEAISGFDNTDLTIPNGTLSTVTSTDGNITFTATYTPAIDVEDDTNIIILDNTGITDSVGNTGTGTTNSSNFIIDMMPPTAIVEISDGELTTGDTATITITFSEAVTGFTNADLTTPNGTLTTVSSTDGNITFTATYTPTTGITDTENSITLDNTGVTDIAGNPGVGVTDSPNFTINTQQEIPVTTLTFDKGFSPNGDGINDTWVIEGIEDFPNHTIQLFSRSGAKVFEAKDYQNNWDGISNGRLAVGNGKLPAGAYYYIIETGSQTVPPLIGWIYINY
ncbi:MULTISPECIES: Ig-like domain-containing protein [unclassified Aquimarina]|uniref:Ig-like domain-containing protein n=3 Tax=Aquimarina TaxID=290174 RepID=UPI0018CA779C|nr:MULTISPECIES: Ig-like domain-containing protein [unclassified Aquimarina]MBG6152367.1 gliding motility-associated-like protein [Aquimarina sp. EL_32]